MITATMLMPVVYMLMRVPPLFIMDSVLNHSFLIFLLPNKSQHPTSLTADMDAEASEESDILLSLAWSFLSLFCFIASAVVFLLSARNLVYTYNFVISVGLVVISYAWNSSMLTSLETVPNPDEVTSYLRTFVINVGVQCGLAYSFNSLRWESPWMTYDFAALFVLPLMKADTYMAFLLPSVVKLLPLPKALCTAALYPAVLPSVELCLYIVTKLPVITETLASGYRQFRVSIRTVGPQGLIEGQWLRLCIPDVLRIFWVIRFTYQSMLLIAFKLLANYELTGAYSLPTSDIFGIGRTLMVNGCDTQIALLGMTSVVSYIAHHVGAGFAAFISLAEEENPNMGAVSATLFFLLALQTGLTSLSPDRRLVRLYRNFCLLTTAILHLVHSMANPVLMSLSAAHSDSVRKHARVLVVCAFLILFPIWLLLYLWTYHTTSTWMLAVTAFSIEVVVKVLVSLCQYTLFMLDAQRETFWEELDDYIYYIRSTGSTIEFIFGIFLFCNGGWILLFESGGFIRALMMCIHAYYNIWVQAKDGWKTFIRRRTAVNKINNLPNASRLQLDRHNDVCAICYQELRTARITHCQHFFHGVCLRKWLYVQDRCPLCHEIISVTDVTSPGDDVVNGEGRTGRDADLAAGDDAGQPPPEHIN